MTNRAAWHRANHPGKVVKARSKNSITFDNGDGSDTTVCTIAPLHKGAGPFTQAEELDTQWQTTTGAWDYHIQTLDFLVQARDTFNVGNIFQFTDPASGEWVQFDPQSLNWVDENYSRQQIAIKQAVTAVPNDYVLDFPAAWGPGRHFRYEATCSRLNKVIQIDAPSDLPAEVLAGTTIHLEAEFSLATSAGVDIYIDGALWNKPNGVRFKTASRIEFRDAATGTQILWWLEAVRAWDSSGDNEIFGELECRRQGGPSSLFITIRIPKPWVDAATFPIYIDPTTAYSGAGDGDVMYFSNSDWATVRDAATGTNADNIVATDQARTQHTAGEYNIVRLFFPCDTSSIPDSDNISAATFNLYCTGKNEEDNDAESVAALIQTSQASSSTLATTDYDAVGTTVGATSLDITAITVSAYNIFTMDSTGISWIDKAGTTFLGVREGHDLLNSPIADNTRNRVFFYMSEQTGTTNDPYLEVTHAPADINLDYGSDNLAQWKQGVKISY